jgi:hypothetical protein
MFINLPTSPGTAVPQKRSPQRYFHDAMGVKVNPQPYRHRQDLLGSQKKIKSNIYIPNYIS